MALSGKPETSYDMPTDLMPSGSSFRSISLKLSGADLPRVLVLGTQYDAVEPACRWLRQAGYPTVWKVIDSPEGISQGIPASEVVLFNTIRPQTDVLPIIDLLRRQNTKRAPVLLVLTYREAVKEMDLTTGIDDFLCAPYDSVELEARIKFTLWRRFGVQLHDLIVCGDLVINLGNYEVTIRGEPADLTLKEYELLTYLATHRSRVFTRDDLLTAVWGYDYFGGARTVDVHVRRLRMKIERHGIKIITTVRGVGYKFGE